MNKPKRGFVVPDGMKDLIDGAKVGTKDGGGAPTPAPTPAPAPEAPQAPQPVKVAQPPAAGPETPPAPAEPAAHVHRRATDTTPEAEAPKKVKPWEDLSRGAKGLNLPMSAELYAKMVWCTENVPKMSLQKLARLGAEKMADELIAQHYKGE